MGPTSLQPEAPQEPGNVLYGRFQSMPRKKLVLIVFAVLAVVLLIWYVRKRR